MNGIMDWFLEKMRLVDVDEEIGEVEQELEAGIIEKSLLELVHWKKDKMIDENSRVYFKSIQTYADCKQVIDKYKLGAVCIYRLDPSENPDAQGMMNYICGGIYALDGEVTDVGENVFMATWRKNEYIISRRSDPNQINIGK